jgi:dTDP-4-dehydrorhamnose reductase
MLALAQTRDEVRVVADQFGCPTYAPDIAVAVVAVARNLLSKPIDPRLRGIFNLAGSEETNWQTLRPPSLLFWLEKACAHPW